MRRKTIVLGICAALLALSFEQANALVTYPFFDGFESGNFSNWTIGSGSYTRTVTSATAATGTYSFTQIGGNSTLGDGVSATFASAQQPLAVSFSVRSSSASNYAGFFSLSNGTTDVVLFYMTTTGYFYLNTVQTTKSYVANTWYNIRFALNWTTHTVDFYVNDVLVSSGVAMRSTLAVDNVKLYNYTAGAQAWWDNISIGDVPLDSTKQIKLIAVPSPTYNRSPVFHWFHHDSISVYKLTVDVSPSFSSPLFAIPLADTFYKPTIDLPFDSIYWKVENYASNKYWSTVSSFFVIDSMQPVISLSPSSLKITSGDTVTKPLSICNSTGRRALTYSFKGTCWDSARILVWTYGISGTLTQYNNILAAIRQYSPAVTFTNCTATDSATLRSNLVGKNVFLIPEQDGSGVSSSWGTTFRNVLTDFVNNGGTILCCYPYTSSVYTFLNNTGLINISYAYYTGTGGSAMTLRTPPPSLLSGITSLTTQNATTYFSVTGTDTANVLATYSSYATVLQKSIGRGSLVILGIDFYQYDSSWAKIISRAASGAGIMIPSWISVSPESGIVAVGQCATAKIRFNPVNLASGTYTTQLLLSHNSLLSANPIAVPCTLVVPPTTMSYTPASFKLTLNTGDSASRTLTLNNTGASGLTYNVRSSASGGAIIINELIYDISSYDEVIELWNRGGDQNMTGWRVVWNDNAGSSGSYTFPSGYIFKAGRMLSCMISTGTNNDSMLYMGVDIAWVSGTQLSVSLFNASAKAVDFVHTSGNADATPSGTTWKGAGVVCSTCEGLARNSNNDNDTASDWTALSGTTSYTLFALNPGQSPVSGISNGSWLSVTNGTGSVSGGGNAVVGVKFNAATMIYSGTFVDSLIITHNASNQANPLIVRCTLVVISNIPALIHYTPNPTSNRKPKLMWHQVASAGSYTIQIADNAAFSSPILVQPVTDTFYQPLIDLPLGPIYWKVKSDLNTTYSLPDLVMIQSDSIPTIILMVPDTITARRPILTWHKAAGAAVYRVQIDTAGNFANPWLSTLVNDTFYIPTIDLPYSRICWRVSNYSYNATAYSAVDTFWVKNPSGVITIRSDMPVTFAMGNGWPNPFMSSTAIPIAIPLNGPSVSIAIYDAKGQVVRVLRNGVLSAGYHNIVFNGKEKNDKALSSGTYFCKMVSGDFKKTIRLLKMK